MQRHGDHDEVGEQYTGDKTYQGTRAEDPDVFLLVTGQPQRNKLPDLVKRERQGDDKSRQQSQVHLGRKRLFRRSKDHPADRFHDNRQKEIVTLEDSNNAEGINQEPLDNPRAHFVKVIKKRKPRRESLCGWSVR